LTTHLTRVALLLTAAILLESCATVTHPWSADLSGCARGSAAWVLVSASAASTSREQCMNERGWISGGEGYRKPSPGEPTVAEMIAKACATEKRFGDSVWFQFHWVKCPEAGAR
jgi:hypothetical protein